MPPANRPPLHPADKKRGREKIRNPEKTVDCHYHIYNQPGGELATITTAALLHRRISILKEALPVISIKLEADSRCTALDAARRHGSELADTKSGGSCLVLQYNVQSVDNSGDVT